jgi:hypothetical protein
VQSAISCILERSPCHERLNRAKQAMLCALLQASYDSSHVQKTWQPEIRRRADKPCQTTHNQILRREVQPVVHRLVDAYMQGRRCLIVDGSSRVRESELRGQSRHVDAVSICGTPRTFVMHQHVARGLTLVLGRTSWVRRVRQQESARLQRCELLWS